MAEVRWPDTSGMSREQAALADAEAMVAQGHASWEPQLTFDAEAAEAAAEVGMDAAATAERVQAWKRAADLWLGLGPAVGDEITADDLIAAVGLPDVGANRNNVVGAWFSAKAKGGALEFAGRYAKSERVVRHGNTQRVWRVAG